MVKWNTVYSHIAAQHGVSSSYVQQIHKGVKPATSDTAKAIQRSLRKAERDIRKLENAVAAA